MQVYILRHGIAEEVRPGGSDADRALTNEGRKKLREVLRLAEKADVVPSLILTSPYVRAVQTAETVMEVLGYANDLLRTEALIPSADPAGLWEEIRVHQGVMQLMLVGHEPMLSKLVAFLLNSSALMVDVKKGALIRIDVEGFGAQPRGILRWMVVPKLAA
jgi:phosphohistidine phosphatase